MSGIVAVARSSRFKICRSRCIRWPISPAHPLLRVGHRRAVRRIIDAVVALPKQLEARHIVGHVAVGRNDDGGRPAHHMIAGEQRADS